MVSPDAEERDYPAYALDRVRELARDGKLLYVGSKVENDAANLGYSLNDVCRYLELLNERNFRKSIQYPNRAFWMDVYGLEIAQDENVDAVYIKLSLHNNLIRIHLHSFHLDQ